MAPSKGRQELHQNESNQAETSPIDSARRAESIPRTHRSRQRASSVLLLHRLPQAKLFFWTPFRAKIVVCACKTICRGGCDFAYGASKSVHLFLHLFHDARKTVPAVVKSATRPGKKVRRLESRIPRRVGSTGFAWDG